MKAFLLLMSFSLPLTVVDAQTKQDNWQNLLRMNQQFENYISDFVQFGKSQHAARSRNSEDLTDVGLVIVADQAVSHLENVETLVAIYLKVTNKQDRLAIWPLITEQMATTSKRLEQQVEVVNAYISVLKNPGVVAETMRMRDDLRKVIENLEGTQKEFEQAEASIR